MQRLFSLLAYGSATRGKEQFVAERDIDLSVAFFDRQFVVPESEQCVTYCIVEFCCRLVLLVKSLLEFLQPFFAFGKFLLFQCEFVAFLFEGDIELLGIGNAVVLQCLVVILQSGVCLSEFGDEPIFRESFLEESGGIVDERRDDAVVFGNTVAEQVSFVDHGFESFAHDPFLSWDRVSAFVERLTTCQTDACDEDSEKADFS